MEGSSDCSKLVPPVSGRQIYTQIGTTATHGPHGPNINPNFALASLKKLNNPDLE